MNTTTVKAMATTEIATPTVPITDSDNATPALNSGGLGLSKMTKFVRWLQSQTVLEVEERLVFLVHPLSDHRPILSVVLTEIEYTSMLKANLPSYQHEHVEIIGMN